MAKSEMLGKVRVGLGERSYDIEIGTGLLAGIGQKASGLKLSGKACVVTNETVGPLYGEAVRDSLVRAGYETVVAEIPDGEQYKSLKWASNLYDRLLGERFDRRSFIVALGGGVVGDLAGFVAATYMRGIPFIQAPTTLLSQVDSSVGGKTGVNHPLGKNMIGAFYQPVHVTADVDTFATLPADEFLSGMAEVVKYGVISDAEFFSFLEENSAAIMAKETQPLCKVITRSCEIKAYVVGLDERESGLRAILNYGHTVGHAIETLTDYTGYRHGEAVSIGMVVAARLAKKMGICGKEVEQRVSGLLSSLGLPVEFPDFAPDKVMEAVSLDKKSEGGKVKMVLPARIGEVIITKEWDEGALLDALKGDG